MTRAEMIATLHKIESAQQDRVEIWRIVVDETGKEISRMYRGSFQQPRESQQGE